MSNLLLITDVARLRKIFGRLTEVKNIRLRVVNNLEKGGEEIAIEKPDVVYVQTHLSGLSADILLMHLKKQLGRKRSRFVLLAPSGQVNDAILKPYQGWLDTSADDGQLFSDLQQLLATLLNKTKKAEEPTVQGPTVSAEPVAQPVSVLETSALLNNPPVTDVVPAAELGKELQLQVSAPVSPEPSLEEQGITYAPRQRLKVYSEFNSSFDNAVSSAPEAEPLEQAIPVVTHDWHEERIDSAEIKPSRSKKGIFLLWLVPVVVAVVVITYLQQKPTSKSASAPPASLVKPAVQNPLSSSGRLDSAKAPAAPITSPAASGDQDKITDKAVLTAISEKREPKSASVVSTSSPQLTVLPKFIPANGLDKQYGAANPGWELYMGNVTEFKVLWEAKTIKAIQVIDRGWRGVSDAFMKRAFRQVTSNPSFDIYTSEKKEGYEIQRGRIADNIKAVYYRDEKSGKLKAFVLTWQ